MAPNYGFHCVVPPQSFAQVIALATEALRLALKFVLDFRVSHTYVLHSHNLDHEDAGMMINFRIRA